MFEKNVDQLEQENINTRTQFDCFTIMNLKELIYKDIEKIKANQMNSIELDMFLQFDVLLQISQLKNYSNYQSNIEAKNTFQKFFIHSINLVKKIKQKENQSQITNQYKLIKPKQNGTCESNFNNSKSIKASDQDKELETAYVLDLTSYCSCNLYSKEQLKVFQSRRVEFVVNVGPDQQVLVQKYQSDLIIRQRFRKKLFFKSCLEQARNHNFKNLKLPIKLFKFDWLCKSCCNINHNQRLLCHSCKSRKETCHQMQAL